MLIREASRARVNDRDKPVGQGGGRRTVRKKVSFGECVDADPPPASPSK